MMSKQFASKIIMHGSIFVRSLLGTDLNILSKLGKCADPFLGTSAGIRKKIRQKCRKMGRFFSRHKLQIYRFKTLKLTSVKCLNCNKSQKNIVFSDCF